ncbi:hypothetical protein LEMLEM_LOCUS15311 [Lemmus lemmus]
MKTPSSDICSKIIRNGFALC